MSTDLFDPERIPSRDLKGQAQVIAEVRRLVDTWRGFPLGPASDPYPMTVPRYEPRLDGELPISETTRRLLQHWFRREPHEVGQAPQSWLFKYWPHQRRLVETFLYLYEVRAIRRTEQLYELAGVEPLGPQRDPWAKLGGQLATGSGKTKMMSLLVAWSYLNALCEPESPLGFGRHSILIAPGLFVRDRLFLDFRPPHGGTSVFFADPVIPPELLHVWDLKVYDPYTCPLRLDPNQGALVVTNYHQLLRTRSEESSATFTSWDQRQMHLMFEGGEPDRLEAIQTPLAERFTLSQGLLVLNDEAHHVWDETGHARFEQKAREKARLNADDAAAAEMAWIRCLRRLHGHESGRGRVALQADLSATLFEETGTKVKREKGQKQEAKFRPADLFRHTVVHYGLAEAIRDGIVKRPVLERVEVRNAKTGEIEEAVRTGQPNAWETYRNLLATGIERWKRVADQLREEGDPRKPILFILCDDRHEAREVANYLRFGEASRDDLTGRPVTGYAPTEQATPLFVLPGPDGLPLSSVVEIHIGQKEEQNEEEWNRIREMVNAIDRGFIPDPNWRAEDGAAPLVPNPYNVVVSVMMLKEGWDVRNVKVIVPLRPCDSRTLTEQTLGRGLRRMHPPALDDEGGVHDAHTEELFVIEHPSFKSIIDQISDLIEEKSSDEIEHSREYVPILQREAEEEREACQVRLVRFEGLVEVVADWRRHFDLRRVPALVPRMAWLEELADAEIRTFLKAALAGEEVDGQVFTLPEVPSYRDFDHILEAAYAIPLLRELRASYSHKTAVKGVVQEFLEQRTFAIPLGLPISFAKALEGGLGKIALGNLARSDVIQAVKQGLLPALHEALTAERPASEALLSERRSAELGNYQALKQNVIEHTSRTTFQRTAVDSEDERRVAALLDRSGDVLGWLYNHRSGVGYAIEYEWQGLTCRYYPDFIVRARLGEVVHNFIVEVKGRLDDRDKAKVRRGHRYCELLTEHDREPWHYLLLVENPSFQREDIGWWERQSVTSVGDLLRRQEQLPILPDETTLFERGGTPAILGWVPEEEQYRDAVPVLDLAAPAGTFGDTQAPEPQGWMRVHTHRGLDRKMFVAKIKGRSMEPAIPDGSWGLFRRYPIGETPASTALDGRRVVVQLRQDEDPELGGAYTLKRWRVVRQTAEDGVIELELRPDNPGFRPIRLTEEAGDVRAVAEFLDVVG